MKTIHLRAWGKVIKITMVGAVLFGTALAAEASNQTVCWGTLLNADKACKAQYGNQGAAYNNCYSKAQATYTACVK